MIKSPLVKQAIEHIEYAIKHDRFCDLFRVYSLLAGRIKFPNPPTLKKIVEEVEDRTSVKLEVHLGRYLREKR